MREDVPIAAGTAKRILFIISILVGTMVGVGAFTFHYAEGLSYFSTDPKACANCHIMQPQYDAWQKASHHTVATCVDCHLPQSFVAKYIAKADNGYHHSKGFTFQDFHEPIMIKPRNLRILYENCMRCHSDLIHEVSPISPKDSQFLRCTQCHFTVGHGPRAGLGGPESDNEPLTRSPL